MIKITEEEFYNSFKDKGFKYDKDLLFNYYNALKSKPFVILTGISGSGKSKIAEIFAETLSPENKKLFELIPVKPNWRDSKSLFGYHNLIDDTYNITPLIKLFIKALFDKENPYFLILDEMNLAKTEHYFADYLSLIESRRLISQKNVTNVLPDNFAYPYKVTVSEAIILAALFINKPNEELKVEEYRNTIFAQKWFEQFSQSNNLTAQFRTELNQKEGKGRLAYRVFDSSGDDSYKLKKLEDIIDNKDRERVIKMKTLLEEILEKYNLNTKDRSKIIEQQNITLHNSSTCLSPQGDKCQDECMIKNCNKYTCQKIMNENSEISFIPPEIPIPLNVFTIGTVNVDETTYMFSPKVLDRANVIEFNNVDFKTVYDIEDSENLLSNIKIFVDDNFYFEAGKEIADLTISIATPDDVKNFKNFAPDEFKDVLKIFASLEKDNLHFGYRVMNEISLYINNIKDSTIHTDKYKVALDLQILQKILPKIHGTFEKIWFPLINILNVCLISKKVWPSITNENQLLHELSIINQSDIENLNLDSNTIKAIFKYPRSANKILSMLNDLNNHGYASYIK
ncbi:AAA family ATPase [Aliarcobacter skirrowii]|uniref:AAA family ATPase n=1 Tax=Aliarcobacter skirrowii TaxID=28200 RepID=A0AAW9DAK3_9BACT|nr:AAA family ATPase [Aliarcobacter skirrowii]MDX4069172.1 AAA family ATPase [Aliarcobacter skirrowii]